MSALKLKDAATLRFGHSNVICCVFLVANIKTCCLSMISKSTKEKEFVDFYMKSNYFGSVIPKKLIKV